MSKEVFKPVSISISQNNFWIFRWTELSPLNQGRSGLALEWVPDGRLFAVGGFDSPHSPLTTVEMLQCPWDTEDLVDCEWRYVSPMHHARLLHGLVYFEGKLIAAGGQGRDSVECFTLPTDDLPDGQWVIIRPMSQANPLFGVLQFGEDLLFVG